MPIIAADHPAWRVAIIVSSVVVLAMTQDAFGEPCDGMIGDDNAERRRQHDSSHL
jgi:hypothetical protein